MFDTLRDNSRIIVYIVVVIFVISGGFMGFGAYLNRQNSGGQSSNQNPSVIAEVNGMEISQQEYFSLLQQQAPQSNLSSTQIIPFRYNVLNALIERKLILTQAEELDLNVEISESEIDENYNNILEQNEMSEQELADALVQQGSTIGELRENIASSLKDSKTITQTIDQSIGTIEVSEQEVQELYNQRYPKSESDASTTVEEDSNLENGADTSVEGEEKPEMEAVRGDLENELRAQKRNEAINSWLADLKENAEITINDPVLSAYHALENENYDQAVEQFSSFVEEEETDPIFYNYLAQAYQGQNNYEQAEEIYNNAVDAFPENNDLKFNYAEFLADQEKEDQAIAQLDSISEAAEDDFMTYYQLFIMYNQLGAEEKAQSAMEKVQQISQNMQQNQQAPEVDEETAEDIQEEAEELEEDVEVESPLDKENNN